MSSDKIKKTILVVDDEIDVSNVISKILKRAGYNVIIANTGEEAVEIAEKKEKIDLILMDIDLGKGIDGTDAARRILKIIDIPIVFHTSHAEEEIVEKVRGITRYGYVIKSSSNFVLQSSIDMAFELFCAHKKIEKSEKLFRGLFNCSLNAIGLVELIYNDDGKLADGRILSVNPAFEKATGLKSDMVVGKLYTEVKPDVLKTDRIQRLDGLLRKGEPYIIEDFYAPAQKYFNFTVHEIEKGLVAIVMEDITAEKMAKQSLIESEVNLKSFQLLHKVTDNLPACIACVNAVDLTYHFVNKAFADTFSKSPEEMVGMYVRDVLGDIAFTSALPYIEKACSGERITYENMVPTGGEFRCFNIDYIPQFDENGKVQSLVIQAVDITERKLSDEKINTLLKEKEILIKEVHHRIKNNMSAISGILSLHSESIEDPAARSSLLDAESRVHSMMVLYDKLYRTDNIIEMPITEYLSPLIDEIICNFPNYEMVRVEKKISDFIIDSKFLFPLGIIVNELITNIMKYAFNGSDMGLINISASADNNYVTIVVQDFGVGLPEHIHTKNSTGFGLNLVGILAEQINGKIKIEREAGTRFILEFKM